MTLVTARAATHRAVRFSSPANDAAPSAEHLDSSRARQRSATKVVCVDSQSTVPHDQHRCTDPEEPSIHVVMSKLITRLAWAGLILYPIAAFSLTGRTRPSVLITADDQQLGIELCSPDGCGSVWSVPTQLEGIFAGSQSLDVRSVAPRVVAARGEFVRASASVAPLKTLGASRVANAVLLDPVDLAPREFSRGSNVRTRLVSGGRSIESTWPTTHGMYAVCGSAHRIFGDPQQTPLIVAVAPEDEPMAQALAAELDELLSLFPSSDRDSVRSALPPQLIISNWRDLDLSDGALERPFANVWIGPITKESGASLHRLARICAASVLGKDRRCDPASVAVMAGAWAELAVLELRGEAPGTAEASRDMQAYRAARATSWHQVAEWTDVHDPEVGKLMGFLAPVARQAVERQIETARNADLDVGHPLGAWLLAAGPREASEIMDFDQALAQAREHIRANSCIEPIESLATFHADRIRWEFVGDHAGYLESCGCKSIDGGGVVDLAARWSDPAVPGVHRVLLGNELSTPDRAGHLDGANEVILTSAKGMHLTAFVPGMLELSALATGLVSIEQFADIPVIACNVQDRSTGESLFPPFIDVPGSQGRRTTRLVGVCRPTLRHSAPFLRGPVERTFRIEDSLQDVLDVIEGTPADHDVVLAGDLAPLELRWLAERCTRPMLAISRNPMVPRFLGDTVEREQVCGRIGNIVVSFATGAAYHLVSASHDPESGTLATTVDRLADRTASHAALDRLREQVRSVLESEQPEVELVFDENLAGPNRTYVGSEACQQCHPSEFTQWLSTGHASAMKTLERVQRHRIRNCVACHVVGFGQTNGFDLERPRTELRGVGCEVCHGPGSEHVGGAVAAIRRSPDERLCASCHTPAHSNFHVSDKNAYRRKVDHSTILEDS